MYCGLLYLLIIYLTKEEINRQSGDSVLSNLALGVIYSIKGILIYLILINLTALTGLIVNKIRRDKIGITSFKVILTITIIGTLIFYLVNFGM